MRRIWAILSVVSAMLFLSGAARAQGAAAQSSHELQAHPAQAAQPWTIHDMYRPRPAVIEPGTASTQQQPGRAPSDAIVLFDGKDLSQWRMEDGSSAKWKVVDGVLEVAPGTGSLRTNLAFGDCQLHIEWTAPAPHGEEGQDRGNSGVFLMGLFEIQVLDSFHNVTYADGQAAAVYGQYPPLVNAMRPPGEWQSYDIIFHRPHFDDGGRLVNPARVTVLHNGVLVQDNVALTGPTSHRERPPYQPMPDQLPLALQDHGNPVRFRNIWLRELSDSAPPLPATFVVPIQVDASALAAYVGHYEAKSDKGASEFDVTLESGHLMMRMNGAPPSELTPESATVFYLRGQIGELIFPAPEKGAPQQLVYRAYGTDLVATRLNQ